MRLFLKILLAIVLWTLFLGLCIGTSLIFEFAIEIAIRIFLLVFIGWYAFKLIRYLVKRWKAKQRVEKLINIDNKGETKRLAFAAFLFPTSVENHLKRVLNKVSGHQGGDLQTSLDDLKWLMHLPLGSSSGQWLTESSAVKPQWNDPLLKELDYAKWRVFNEFFMLDVDQHVINSDDESARAQWFELLDGLSYCKKAIALDGLVVSVDIQQLLDENQRQVIADQIRARVEDIKQHTGADIAVSFVLEGLENLAAVTHWVEHLSAGEKSSPLGRVNNANQSFSDLVDGMLAELMSQFSLASLNHLMDNGFDKSAAELPAKIETIAQQLSQFGSRCFNQNQFQSTPRLNGVFFTVEHQKHHWFVAHLLEGQKFLAQPPKQLSVTTHADKQKQKKVGLYAFIALAVVALLNMVKDNDGHHIIDLFEDYQAEVVVPKSLKDEANNLSQRYQLISALAEVSVAHWLPTGEDGIDVKRLRQTLHKDIEMSILTPLDSRFSVDLSQFSGSDDERIDYLNILIRRAQLLQAAINGATYNSLRDMPQPYDSYYIETLDADLLDQVNVLFLNSLQLQKQVNPDTARELWLASLQQTRTQVTEILLSSDGDLQWLTQWVSQNATAAKVSLSDYWGGDSSTIQVAAAYTRVGKAQIDEILQQIEDVLGPEHAFVVRYLPEYVSQYQFNYQASWKVFLEQFASGVSELNSREDWLGVINNLPTGRNIFFKVLNDADYELSVLDADYAPGSWLEFVFYYQEMLAQSSDEIQTNSKKNKVFTKLALKVIGATGSVGKAVAQGGKSGMKTKAKVDKASGAGPGPSERELNLQAAADTLDAYKKGVSELVFNIEQKTASLSNMQGLYSNISQPSAADTPLGSVQKQLDTLHALIGKRGHSSEAFWAVFTGPIAVLEKFMRAESGCELNQRWADDFLFQLYGVPDYKIPAVAYGESGLLWQHIDAQIAPYLRKGVAGTYGLRQLKGHAMPINTAFVQYLSKANESMSGQKFESFALDITMAPTSVNENSMLYVASTQLSMMCEETTHSLLNRNFIDTQPLQWEETCNRIELSFEVGNRTLVKRYNGRQGTIDFLQQFSSGKVRFDVESFPQDFYLLKQYQVRYLDVNLSIGSGDKLLKHLSYAPPSPPKHIAQCWSASHG